MKRLRTSPSRGTRAVFQMNWSLFIAAGLVFIGIQTCLALFSYQSASGARLSTEPLSHRLIVAIVASVIGYVGFSTASITLARRLQQGWVSLTPTLLYVLAGAALSPAHLPSPIGPSWTLSCSVGCTDPAVITWIGTMVDLLLLAIPLSSPLRVWRVRLNRSNFGMSTMAASVVAAVVVVLVYRTVAIKDAAPELSATLSMIAFGALAGIAKPRFLWVHVLLAAAASGASTGWLAAAIVSPTEGFALREGVPYFSSIFVPLLCLTVAASSWEPVKAFAVRLQGTPKSMLVIVNSLNIADALLTARGVNSGDVEELNPLIKAIGFPAKIVLVAVASWMIYRLRPRFLLWPTLVLLLLFVYHLSGLVISAG